MLLFMLQTTKVLNEAKYVLCPVCGEITIKEKRNNNNNAKTEQTRTMTTTDISINNMMMPPFLKALTSNFRDKHRNALDKGRDEDRR